MNFFADDPEELSRLEAAQLAGRSHAKNGARFGAIGGGLGGLAAGALAQFSEDGGHAPKDGSALLKYLAKMGIGGAAGAGIGGLAGAMGGGLDGMLEGAMTPQYYRKPRNK